MKFSLTLGLLLSAMVAFSQPQKVDFGVVYENAPQKKTVKFSLGHTATGTDSIMVYFRISNHFPYANFSLDMDSIKLASSTVDPSVDVWLKPNHNVVNNAMLYIETKSALLKAVELSGQGAYSRSLYASTRNKTAEALKAELKTVSNKNFSSVSYNTARDNMYATIDNENGFVECVYTGTKAQFNSRAGANNAGFNCEHTFPQGFFGSATPMKSDIHHLFPTTVTSNSRRGNDPFGAVSNPSWNQGGSKSGGGKFEPRDYHKGTVARAMTYFVLKYQDYSNHYKAQETTLRNWYFQYPPNQQDSLRNEEIAKVQGNRNPFVDYPQFLERISSVTGNATDASLTYVTYNDYASHGQMDTVDGASELDIVIYNGGTEPVKIDTFYTVSNIGSSKLEVKKAYGTETVAPASSFGLSILTSIQFAGHVTFDDSLIIMTDMPGNNRVSIPIELIWDTGSDTAGTVNELDISDKITVYPNPTRGLVNLSGVENEDIEIVKLYSLTGELVREFTHKRFYISGLAEGVYTIEVDLIDGARVTKRLVLQ